MRFERRCTRGWERRASSWASGAVVVLNHSASEVYQEETMVSISLHDPGMHPKVITAES